MFGKKKRKMVGKKVEPKKDVNEIGPSVASQKTSIKEPAVKMLMVGEAIPIQYIENFFKYFINPSLTEAKVEKKTAAALKNAGAVPFTWIFIIAVLLIAGAVAYSVVTGATSNSECQQKLGQIAAGNTKVVNNPAAGVQPNPNIGGTTIK